MKEKEFIKKLKNNDLPAVEMQSHRRRLKMALLAAGCPQKQRGFSLLFFKTITKGGMDIIMKGLLSRQPVWKTACIGIIAVALVVGLSLTIPSLTTESVYAQAEEIAQNSPEVHAALGVDGEFEVIKIDIADDKGTVIAQGEAGIVSATVDLKTNSVTEVATFEFDEQVAIEIAKADTRVKELLDSGATIDEVSTMYISGAMGNVATGETENFVETYVIVKLKDNDNLYVARIDLDEGKVVDLIEIALDAVSEEPPAPAVDGFFIPDTATVSTAMEAR